MGKRAVLYARVSSDDRGREGRNLAGQIEMGRKYAQEHGYVVVAVLAEDDRGASGAEINLPELNQAREMARTGEFDVLVVREIDRLSRNLAKQLIVEQELKQAGVLIEYVIGEYSDTPEGRLNKHIKATVAEYEREKIAERTSRARRRKVQDGHVIVHGRPPYGYRLADVEGKRTLVIHEPEAKIVRRIFAWYTQDGLTTYAVAKRLTAERVPTLGDTLAIVPKQNERGRWPVSTIAKLLHNETYTGKWSYGKRKRVGGKRVTNPASHWVTVEVPAIVDTATWERAQVQMKRNWNDARRNTKHEYLLRRRALCGKCHTPMNCVHAGPKATYGYYRCPVALGAYDYAKQCARHDYYRSDQVDAAVWDWIKTFLANPQSLLTGLQTERRELEEANLPLRNRLAVIDGLVTDNRRQLEKLLDLYLDGDFTKEALTERKTRLEGTIGALERERADLATQLAAQTLTDGQVRRIAGFAREVAVGLRVADADFEVQRRLVEVLDVWVTLAVENGQKVAYVRCLVGDEALLVTSSLSCSDSHSPYILTARLVLG